MQRHTRCCFVQLEVLRAEVPEIVREDDGLIISFRTGLIPKFRDKVYILRRNGKNVVVFSRRFERTHILELREEVGHREQRLRRKQEPA